MEEDDELLAATADGEAVLVLDSQEGEVALLEAETSHDARAWRLRSSGQDCRRLLEAQGGKVTGVVLRGSGEQLESAGLSHLPCYNASPDSACRGLARLAAAEAQLTRAPQVIDSLAGSIGLLSADSTETPAELLSAWSPLPAVAPVLSGSQRVRVVALEDGGWRSCCADIGGKESRLVSVAVDRDGLLSLDVERIGTPFRSWSRWLCWAALVCLLALALVRSHILGARREGLRLNLERYLAVHNPSEIKDIPQWIERFAGREEELINALQSKYKAPFQEEL
ncbi:unnamed protein product [Effrenium voratum]|nr:unnamed protein product [Effrenium voratum]